MVVVRCAPTGVTRRRGQWCCAALAAWMVLSSSARGTTAAQDPGPDAQATASALYLEVALRLVQTAAATRDPADLALAEDAVRLAGRSVEPVLAARLALSAGDERGAVLALALARSVRPTVLDDSQPSAASRAALGAALWSPALETRLAAASALGELEVRSASVDIAQLLRAQQAERDAPQVLLFALAGTGGDEAAAAVDGWLARGGGPEWAAFATTLALRRGRAGWRQRLDDLLFAPDPTVRAVAVTTLVLLAEPRAACEMEEAFGREPEQVIRRLLLRAIAASSHPAARSFLAFVARSERDDALAAEAGGLASDMARAALPSGARTPLRGVRETLELLAAGQALAQHVADVEVAADPSHVELLDQVLRLLPLRRDTRWLEDHARLARLRARLACADGVDCAGGGGR